MSDLLRYEFALQEPAMAVAPVFLALSKGKRGKLDITYKFGVTILTWRGPDTLGIPEQSVMLGLLCIAAQQDTWLSRANAKKLGTELIRRLCLSDVDLDSGFLVVQTSWNRLVAAAGYQETAGGAYVRIVQTAVQRLAETTMWETRGDEKSQSHILSWVKGNKEGVLILLNRRATEALSGGQYVKISLIDRTALRSAPAKALHAWLSGCVRVGATSRFALSRLQIHVWGTEATGSTLRSRLTTLREALADIGKLPGWQCTLSTPNVVDVTRFLQGVSPTKLGNIAARQEVLPTAEIPKKVRRKASCDRPLEVM
jgi:hypothetical protein